MAEHTLKRFDEELERLSSTISEMGGLAETALTQCLVALRQGDSEVAEQVIAADARVDALDNAVQEQTVKLLALRQPMAVDLRVILSSIKIAAALERIADYAKKARDGKLSLEELQGGTFTVTNGGTFGSMMSTPIVNPPQSAILGMHAIKERPIAENGQVVIAPMMYLALSYDHRIIDGKDSVQFLVDIKNQLENPGRMLFGL